jgi:hypothetical protein
MFTPARRAVVATAAAALLAIVAVPPAYAQPPSTAVPAAAPITAAVPSGTHTVTLITGDVVTTRETGPDGGIVEVRRPDGAPAAVHVIESNHHLYAYPLAALPYVAAGSLDRALFDVTGLIADRYDDAHTGQLPLIVRYADGLRAPATPAGATQVRSLSAVHGAALVARHDQAGDL